MERRNFIRTMIGGTGLLVLPLNLKAFGSQVNHNIKFGACADVHQDVMHDEVQRMETFVAAAQKQKLDFIIQIGDFCRHYEYNQVFMDAWNSYPGDKYHVIGNHDMDGDFSREDVLKYWDISHKYYSFDQGGFHIIVLDGNDKNPFPNKASGYARFIGNKQLKWLEKDLKSTNLPCLIFSHQTLDNNKDGIENRDDIRQLFKKENEKSGFK